MLHFRLMLTCWLDCSSTANAPFWIPVHIVIPERPTECAVFNVIAGLSPFLYISVTVGHEYFLT